MEDVLWTVIIAAPGRVPDAPWDDPAAIRRHIVETLPGTTFNGQVGSFTPSTYAITFTLTDDGGAIEVEATDPRAEQAVLRVVRRTGWQVVDARGQLLEVPGAPVPRPRAAVAPAAAPAERDSRSVLSKAVTVAGLLVAVVASVQWARTFQPATLAQPATASAPAPAAPSTPGAAPEPGSRGRLRQRFRDDPIAAQFVAYVEASLAFRQLHKEPYAWLDPAALAWPLRMTNRLEPIADALLPPAFRTTERDGYRFTFERESCESRPRPGAQPLAIERCISAAYVAIPLAPGKPSFALRTSNWNLRYRDDGVLPGPRDGLAANFDPKQPDGPPPGDVPPAPSVAANATAPPWVAMMWDTWESAVGLRSTQPPPQAAHEDAVAADLRALAAAQRVFAERAGNGHFTDLGRLMQPMTVNGRTASPTLPPWYTEAERHGYRFEFSGTATEDQWTTGLGRDLGPHFSAFRYVAHPADATARTLAIYTDGGIRVATGRVPAPTDPLLRTP